MTAKQIIAEVAAAHSIPAIHLTKRLNSHPEVVRARADAARRIRAEVGMSLPQIGRLMGLHHSTVLYHCKGITPREDHMDTIHRMALSSKRLSGALSRVSDENEFLWREVIRLREKLLAMVICEG